MDKTCKCGNQAMHTVFEQGEAKRLCCKCYIKAGNTPADWHPDCMREAGRLNIMDKAKAEMIQDVAKNGGEYTYLTVKGKIKDVHHRTAEDLRKEQERYGQT